MSDRNSTRPLVSAFRTVAGPCEVFCSSSASMARSSVWRSSSVSHCASFGSLSRYQNAQTPTSAAMSPSTRKSHSHPFNPHTPSSSSSTPPPLQSPAAVEFEQQTRERAAEDEGQRCAEIEHADHTGPGPRRKPPCEE